MLVQYTPIASLSEEQLARLKAASSTLQLEGQAHLTFEGMVISKADLYAHFPRNEQKKTPGPLFG